MYLDEVKRIAGEVDLAAVEAVAAVLADVREGGGRLFVLGVGGSAASGSHLVNDLRKIVQVEAYAPTDNVSELTARVNDEGWATCFAEWLKGSRLREADALIVLSVGGGDEERNISPNLVAAIRLARERGARVVGIVGRDGGYTAREADACVLVPVVHPDRITPHTEAFHSVIGHLLVSHPLLKAAQTKWEGETAT